MDFFVKIRRIVIAAVNAVLPEKILVKIKQEGFRKYFKNTGWMMVAQVINIVVSFFVSAYVTRYLGPTRIGIISFGLSYVGIFSFIATLGIDSIIYRDLVKRPEDEDKILGTAFFIKLAGGVVSFILIAASVLFIQANDLTTALITIIIALSFIFQPIGIISYYFQSKVKSKITSLVAIGVLLSLSLLKVVFIILGLDVYWFAVIFLFEQIFYGVGYIYYYSLEKRNIFGWRFDFGLAKSIIHDSWPLLFSLIFFSVNGRIDQVIIGMIMDKASLGLYSTMVKVSELWIFLPNIITVSLFPAIINAKKSSSQLFESRMIRLYNLIFWISLVMIVIIYVFAWYIVYILYGAEFLPIVPMMRIYIFSGLAFVINVALNQWLIVQNYTKVALFCSVVGGILNIGMNFLLIPIYGIWGAIIASLISYFAVTFSILFFKKTRSHALLIIRGVFFKF